MSKDLAGRAGLVVRRAAMMSKPPKSLIDKLLSQLSAYAPDAERNGYVQPTDAPHPIHAAIRELHEHHEDRKLPPRGRKLWHRLLRYSRRVDSDAFECALDLYEWIEGH